MCQIFFPLLYGVHKKFTGKNCFMLNKTMEKWKKICYNDLYFKCRKTKPRIFSCKGIGKVK